MSTAINGIVVLSVSMTDVIVVPETMAAQVGARNASPLTKPVRMVVPIDTRAMVRHL